MPPTRGFQHLPLLLRVKGRAKLQGGGDQSSATRANRVNFAAHAGQLTSAALAKSNDWKSRQVARQQQGLPDLAKNMPVLLQMDPGFDIDILREKFAFEIVSEQEDGFVIVAAADVDLTALVGMINDYATDKRGSATIASVHKLYEDPDQQERLPRVLSEGLMQAWRTLDDNTLYRVDIGIECLGPEDIPDLPTRGKRDTDQTWAQKQAEWSHERAEAYQAWDEIKIERENEITQFVTFYQGRIVNIIDDQPADSVRLPDSFTVRIDVNGKGLRDLVLNYAFIFEVIESEDVVVPKSIGEPPDSGRPAFRPLPPNPAAPAVCVIDSGVQEGHLLLEPAIDKDSSHCFLPGESPGSVGDFVRPGGHGTRVAGAVLYGEAVSTRSGDVPLDCWVQNARVLNADGRMPTELFPPAVIRAVVDQFHTGSRGTRLFNHSINTFSPCRLRHMSAWAAEIDALCERYDILVVQSAGNLQESSPAPMCGVFEHLAAGRPYPAYLTEATSRIANPAQSLQALTVGSVAYRAFETGDGWRSFASEPGHSSAFSRTGFGIWNVIKPEVVEFGGDNLRTSTTPANVGTPSNARDCYPELVRSTIHAPGPAVDRDAVGTSYAAPKITRIAAALQVALPHETCLLYRALIVQSARWPQWAVATTATDLTQVLRRIGHGIPDLERATGNTPHRFTSIASREAGEEGRELRIKARECHIYQIRIPDSLRRQADEYDILIEVTLSYAAQPRRTRRNLRRYLSTWVDWKASKLGEPLSSFRGRALKDDEGEGAGGPGTRIPWMIGVQNDASQIRGVRRNAGTVQKDWAVVKSNSLPEDFCIAVVGHPGWSKDPDTSAKYAIAVSFEIVGREIPIYEAMRIAVEELQAEIEIAEVSESEVDVSE